MDLSSPVKSSQEKGLTPEEPPNPRHLKVKERDTSVGRVNLFHNYITSFIL